MAAPLLPLIGKAGALIGISFTTSWIERNVIGASGWLQNVVDPVIRDSVVMPSRGDVGAWFSEQYYFGIHLLAPSNEDIKALDDFFESYGYNVSRFMKPNLKVRSTFTYIKTRDAVVYSSNIKAMQQMQAMLNGGTKFWVGEIGK